MSVDNSSLVHDGARGEVAGSCVDAHGVAASCGDVLSVVSVCGEAHKESLVVPVCNGTNEVGVGTTSEVTGVMGVDEIGSPARGSPGSIAPDDAGSVGCVGCEGISAVGEV